MSADVTPGDIAARRAVNPLPGLREPALAFCLSGGGYRAMLFHLGAVLRLNEFGLLSVVDRVSSVSGGSLVAAALARYWADLDFGSDGASRNLGWSQTGSWTSQGAHSTSLPG